MCGKHACARDGESVCRGKTFASPALRIKLHTRALDAIG